MSQSAPSRSRASTGMLPLPPIPEPGMGAATAVPFSVTTCHLPDGTLQALLPDPGRSGKRGGKQVGREGAR